VDKMIFKTKIKLENEWTEFQINYVISSCLW
jgi:hypothetical protein